MLNVEKFDLQYTKCYCEENIYLLCKDIEEKQNEMLKSTNVIYISNDNKMVLSFIQVLDKCCLTWLEQVPLWKQKAGVDQQPVVWVTIN